MNINIFNLNLDQKWKETIRRFPIVMTMAVIMTAMLIYYIADSVNVHLFKTIISGFIGLLSALVLTQYINHHPISLKSKIVLWVMVLVLTIGYYLMVPLDIKPYSCFWVFTVGLSISLHILVGLVPYIDKSDNKSFTSYNTILFVSWWQTTFISLILYGVLFLCFVALENLFGVKLPSNTYAYLFVLIAGLFHTSYFLSEIPDDTDVVAKPKYVILKILLWYVMVPSLYIFGSILMAYLIKTIFTSNNEYIESIALIMWYSLLSMLVWLLLYFYNEIEQPRWVMWFRKNYYIISLPIWIGLFVNIYLSIKHDGITDENYFWAASNMFLLIVGALYIFYQHKADIRSWPALFVFMVLGLTLPGPLSFCKVPLRNQQERLASMMKDKGFIVNDSFVTMNKPMWKDSLGKWNSVIYNLENRNGLEFLNAYNKNKVIAKDTLNSVDVLTYLGAQNYDVGSSRNISHNIPLNRINLEGWAQILPIKHITNTEKGDCVMISDLGEITLKVDQKTIGTYNLASWIKGDSIDTKQIPHKIIYIGNYKLGLIFTSINADLSSKKEMQYLTAEGIVLLK